MRGRKHNSILILNLLFIFVISGCLDNTDPATTDPQAKGERSELVMEDEYTLIAEKHLLHGYSAYDVSGLINVVVEIPTGTNAKWEVDKQSGELQWEFKKGKPRVVAYLGYPGNYGMVPGSLLQEELGGDGDPLDVIILSPALPRGGVVQVRPIGVLKMRDNGERDDKIIAVLPGSKLGGLKSIDDLKDKFGGVLEIIQLWFANYKGPGKMQLIGYGDQSEAEKIIRASVEAYNQTL